MARAKSSRLEQIRTWYNHCMESGYPQELVELFTEIKTEFDNADRLTRMFGVVDEGSVDKAWELYKQYISGEAAPTRRTLH